MDKIKREALDLAMRSIAGRPAEEIVKAAEVFEAYLTSGPERLVPKETNEEIKARYMRHPGTLREPFDFDSTTHFLGDLKP